MSPAAPWYRGARMPPGVEVWRGPSLIDAAPIVALITMISINPKTGMMPQAWILRADVPPHDATRTDADRSICGDCALRAGPTGRSCYVQTWLGPLNVFRAWQRGDYPAYRPEQLADLFDGLPLRLAAYGDPAAVPWEGWAPVLEVAQAIAYTHLWRTCDPRWAARAMASVETLEDAAAAAAAGWRPFRIRLEDEPLEPGEVGCPASAEAGHRTTCVRCGLCDGAQRAGGPAIAIVLHGTRTRRWIERREGLERYALAHATTRAANWKGRRAPRSDAD